MLLSLSSQMITEHIQIGDNRKVLRELPDNVFNTCITSPPHMHLRDYQHESQIGRESTPDAYVRELVGHSAEFAVFRS